MLRQEKRRSRNLFRTGLDKLVGKHKDTVYKVTVIHTNNIVNHEDDNPTDIQANDISQIRNEETRSIEKTEPPKAPPRRSRPSSRNSCKDFEHQDSLNNNERVTNNTLEESKESPKAPPRRRSRPSSQNSCRSYDLHDPPTSPTRPPRRRTSSQSSSKKISSSTTTARLKSPPQTVGGGYQNMQNKPPVPSLKSSIRIIHKAEEKSDHLKRSASLADVTNKQHEHEQDNIRNVDNNKEKNSKISRHDSMKECNSKMDKRWADVMNRSSLSLNMPYTMIVTETNLGPHDNLANYNDKIADNITERMMVSTEILHKFT